MLFFSRNCTHILTRTQGKKFEYMFLAKIASEGTSLNAILLTEIIYVSVLGGSYDG